MVGDSDHCRICGDPLELSSSGIGWERCERCANHGGFPWLPDHVDNLRDIPPPCPQRVPPETPPLPPNWQELRHATLRRAGWTCEEIGCNVRHDPPKSILEVHHDQARRHGGSHNLDNLVALCRKHHSIRTRGENEGDEYERSMNTDFRPDRDPWSSLFP